MFNLISMFPHEKKSYGWRIHSNIVASDIADTVLPDHAINHKLGYFRVALK